MRLLFLLLLICAFQAATPRPAGATPALDSLLARYPADSLVGPLRRFESEHGRFGEGGEAALLLGRLHYARGEYRQAADAFARAAARLDPSRKHEARYGVGLSWLALKEPQQARAALEEVAASGAPRRPDAQLAIAIAWDMANRPDQALDVLERLLASDPGEAGPPALERVIGLSQRLHRPEDAQRARSRLLRDYPRSMEAAQATTPEVESHSAPAGAVAVQLGVFSRKGRAETLAASARRAGFAAAQVVTRGDGQAKTFIVRLGLYANTAEATKAGNDAARKLGVSYRVVGGP